MKAFSSPHDQERRSTAEGSTRTVVVALAAGLGVALAKTVAAVITASPAMTAEASHSLADSANDLFLLIAQRRSQRPPDDNYPLGHGRDAYFWALLAALGIFLSGAAFSLREGIDALIHPTRTSAFLVAYVILAVSTVLDLVSFRQSVRQMVAGARRTHRRLLDHAAHTSDPMLRGVFNEDSASIVGDVAAFGGLGISQAIGSSVPQAIAAVAIGLLLIRISLRLIRRNHDFLLGQPVPVADQQRARSLLLENPDVTAVHQMLAIFLGPNQVWIVARIGVSGSLCANKITSLGHEIETALRSVSDSVSRVDIVIADSPSA